MQAILTPWGTLFYLPLLFSLFLLFLFLTHLHPLTLSSFALSDANQNASRTKGQVLFLFLDRFLTDERWTKRMPACGKQPKK